MRSELCLTRELVRPETGDETRETSTVASGLMVSAIGLAAGLVCLLSVAGLGMLWSILIAWMCCNILVPLGAILRSRRACKPAAAAADETADEAAGSVDDRACRGPAGGSYPRPLAISIPARIPGESPSAVHPRQWIH